jgi:CHAT domain-containing protein
MICRQLCAENRHSEALEVARFRKRLSPALHSSSSRLSQEEAVLLCCSEVMLDKVEDFYGAISHGHGHIDMRTIRLRSRLFQPLTNAEELDCEAMDLVSCYADVDYPRGALFVLQLLLMWKSKHRLAFAPNHVELVRSLESQTGELLPLAELDSIPPSQHCSPIHRPPAVQTDMVIRPGLASQRSQPVNQEPSIDGVINRSSTHATETAQQQSSSQRSQNPFSRLARFIRGEFSEERFSASGPLSSLETFFLVLNIQRSLKRDGLQDDSVRRKLRVLSERMPHSLREEPQIQSLRGITMLTDVSDDDPVQAIEVAEATLRSHANRPILESWIVVALSHVRLGHAHSRLRNLDKAIEHFGMAKAAAENPPPKVSANVAPIIEVLQFIIEWKKEFQPGRDIDDLTIESTRKKALQLIETSGSSAARLLISPFVTAFFENPRFLSETNNDTSLTPNMRAQLDFIGVKSRALRPTAAKADFDALKQKLQTFEELREMDQTRAKSLAMSASGGYFILGHSHTTRALETNPSSIELLRQARLYHQAALGAVEYVGVGNNPRRYAEYLWAVGETWKFEGIVSHDPAAFQSALEEFWAAEDMLHESRGLQEPTVNDPLQKLIAKQQVVGLYDAIRIFRVIFQCCWLGATYARNETQRSSFFHQAWEMVQRGKSRSLLDVMALEVCIPMTILQALRQHPEQNALLQEETRLMAALSSGLPADRTAIRNSLQSLRKTMKQYYLLDTAMQARDGEGFKLDDLGFLAMRISSIGSRVVFVDWFSNFDSIFLFTAACNGLRYQIFCHRLSISENTVSAWVRSNLKTHVLSNNEDAYYRLKELKDLIAPLKSATMPGDVLVLCPTATLYHIPLHALEIDGTQILLERNPVVYTPSLSILRHQLHVVENIRTMQNPQPWRASVMSVYEDSGPQNPPHEVAAVRDCMSDLASALSTTVQSGPHVNVPYFRDYVRDADLIHFHGHAVSGSSAENQALVLQPSTSPSSPNLDHHLTARSIFTSLTLNRNPLVVNIACASGSQEIKSGDEPFGLTTAFFFAGAKTVVGTLWPLKSADGRSFTRLFYGAMREQRRGAIVDVARAVQKAALEIRDVDATEAPYHWASFVVCGLWEYPFGGKIGELGDGVSTPSFDVQTEST